MTTKEKGNPIRRVLSRIMGAFSSDLAIDLGTANTLVYAKNRGLIIDEPSVVAVYKNPRGGTSRVLAVGKEAKEMLGRTPGSIVAIRPMKDGVIADFEVCQSMLKYFIAKSNERVTLVRPRIIICVPFGITQVERRAVRESAQSAGAREVFLIEEPMAAAIGAGVSVFEPTGIMTVDIGGGTTEIAVISLGGIVVNRSLKLAGYDMDQAIVHYIRLKHGLIIGEKTAEEVKIKIGSAYTKVKKTGEKRQETESENQSDSRLVASESSSEKVALIRGRDVERGLPRSLRITESEIREAIGQVINDILDSVMEVVEETPPELTSDILEHGILLTGGGALLKGIDELIVERTKLPVTIVEDPLTTVVRGCAKLLDNPALLNQVKVTGGLR